MYFVVSASGTFFLTGASKVAFPKVNDCTSCVFVYTIQIDRKEMRATSLPAVRCQDYLEAVEDRYRRSIPTDYDRATKCRLDDGLQ